VVRPPVTGDEAPYDAAVRRFLERQPTRLRPRAHTAVARVRDGIARFFMRPQRNGTNLLTHTGQGIGTLAYANQQHPTAPLEAGPQLTQGARDVREVLRVEVRCRDHRGLEHIHAHHGPGAGRRYQRCVIMQTEIAFEPDQLN
jgi:hypothetical protein